VKETQLQVPLTLAPAGPSPRTLGATAFAAGLIALSVSASGSPSWILLGAALAVWSFCGWAIYFRRRSLDRVSATLGSVLLLSAAAAALVVLSGLYLLALGPSWIL